MIDHGTLEDLGIWRQAISISKLCVLELSIPFCEFRRCGVRLHPFVSSTFGEKAVDLKAWDAVGVNASGLGAKTIELIML